MVLYYTHAFRQMRLNVGMIPPLGVNSQNFIGKFVRFLVSLGFKILRLFRLKVLFEVDTIKGDVNYCIDHYVPIFM